MSMLNRRRLIILASTLAPAARLLSRPARAQQSAAKAADFVRRVADKLVAVVNGPGTPQSNRPKLTSIIDEAVDVDSMARFCLGRFWRIATPEQQKRYIDLFHQVLVTHITGKVGEYQGVRFQMGLSQLQDETAKVSTVVERPNSPATNVDWIIGNPGSDPKIIDVVAEGTSLRLTQRSDYMSYLAHNNSDIDALIGAMRQQVTLPG